MIKDRAQKATALRLCVSKRWLPQLEVDIESSTRTERTKYLLTDLDVLGIAPSPIGGHVRMVFDCKSGARESAIGRAFWLHGVMTRASAMHGFVVLNDKVSVRQDHRISATDLAISLLHENEFEDLAQGLGGTTAPTNSATEDIEAWEQHLAIDGKYPLLKDYLNFSGSRFWMIKDAGEQCRKTVAKLRSIRNELDPSKPEHLAIFGDALCLFLLAISELANRLFLVLLRPSSRDEFSISLLALLYGGYENVEAAQKIRKLTSSAVGDDAFDIFPELKRFEQLIREILQAPQQALPGALLARELGLVFLTHRKTTDLQKHISIESPHAPKYIVMASEYLQKAARLPPEFSSIYCEQAIALSSASLIASK